MQNVLSEASASCIARLWTAYIRNKSRKENIIVTIMPEDVGRMITLLEIGKAQCCGGSRPAPIEQDVEGIDTRLGNGL